MFRAIQKSDPIVVWANESFTPIITFEDKETNGRAHIVLDDGSYVLLTRSKGTVDEYFPTQWWFSEAVEALSNFINKATKSKVSVAK